MSTVRLSETTPPAVRTIWGRLLHRGEWRVEYGNDVVRLEGKDRQSAAEMLGVGYFIGVWMFVAAGCLLPWHGGDGTWPRWTLCALAWFPLWFLLMQFMAALSGGLGLLLIRRRVLSTGEGRLLAHALPVVMITALAVYLASGTHAFCQTVGWIWLLALGIEGAGRAVRLLGKLAVVRGGGS
jgi:hypothetical protein